MSVTTPGDFSVIDTENSTTVALGSSAIFTGTFVNVTDYTFVTVSVNSDKRSIVDGIEVHWSTDGTNLDQVQAFTYDGPTFTSGSFVESDGIDIHVPVRAQFYRLKYRNDFTAQGFFRLQALLKKGGVSGTVLPIAPDKTIFTNSLEGALTLGVMAGQGDENTELVIPIVTTSGAPIGGGYLITHPPPALDNRATTITSATLTEVNLDAGFGRTVRRYLSIFNDTSRGNLFLKMARDEALEASSGVSTTNFHYKIPPQHCWTMPFSWGISSARPTGVWDKVDGQAICHESKR